MALTIRLNEEEQEKLDNIQSLMGEATATKAIKRMVDSYEYRQGLLKQQNIKIEVLKAELAAMKSLLRRQLDLQTEAELVRKETMKTLGMI